MQQKCEMGTETHKLCDIMAIVFALADLVFVFQPESRCLVQNTRFYLHERATLCKNPLLQCCIGLKNHCVIKV